MRARNAWVQTSARWFTGFAKHACKEATEILGFSRSIVACSDEFVALQEARHKADYDPEVRFTCAVALNWVNRAEAAIKGLQATAREDQRAFAIQLLLKRWP